MSTTVGIYVVWGYPKALSYISCALHRLRADVDYLCVVANPDIDSSLRHQILETADVVLDFKENNSNVFTGYKQAVAHLEENHKGFLQNVVFMSNHVFGPLYPVKNALARIEDNDVFCGYFHNSTLDPRLSGQDYPEHILVLDFMIVGRRLLDRGDFWEFWKNVHTGGDYWRQFVSVSGEFSKYLRDMSARVLFDVEPALLETADPKLYEIHKIAENKGIVLNNSIFLLDPFLHDLYSIYLKQAMDVVRKKDPEIYQGMMEFALRYVRLRELHSVADEVFVLDDKPAVTPKTWSFGQVGVFIHAFYASMMPEFWSLIEKIPGDFKLYITTATEENKIAIDAFLEERGIDKNKRDVRVVEQNRGRDMSSLFISFRDVIIAGTHEVALRLHSKRTPQVARQVGESFKDHLFQNLVYSTGYVENVYDLLESQPDLGLLMPPTIHIGFATLGHSWFGNRTMLKSIAKDMHLDVPLDVSTPLAPYGTMYWFRTKALARMFEWHWKFESYNEEPMHVDGGLAHVQERLIPYVVQDAGYRVVSIMNRDMAGRNYAKMEYKLQRLLAHLPPGHVINQERFLNSEHYQVAKYLEAKVSPKNMKKQFFDVVNKYKNMLGKIKLS